MRAHRPSPALVISLVALFVALGGSSVAAVALRKNSVGSKQLKAGAVHRSDLAKNAVTSPKVKNGSLLDEDFKAGELPTGARGATGARGPTGPTGPRGAAGPAAASFLSARFQESFGTVFGAPIGSSTSSATESEVSMVSPASRVVARDLFVLSDDSPADERDYTLMVNGTATGLSCTIAASSIGNENKSCSDAAHAVTIAPGSTISLRFRACGGNCGGGTGTPGFARVGWRATTP